MKFTSNFDKYKFFSVYVFVCIIWIYTKATLWKIITISREIRLSKRNPKVWYCSWLQKSSNSKLVACNNKLGWPYCAFKKRQQLTHSVRCLISLIKLTNSLLLLNDLHFHLITTRMKAWEFFSEFAFLFRYCKWTGVSHWMSEWMGQILGVNAVIC